MRKERMEGMRHSNNDDWVIGSTIGLGSIAPPWDARPVVMTPNDAPWRCKHCGRWNDTRRGLCAGCGGTERDNASAQ